MDVPRKLSRLSVFPAMVAAAAAAVVFLLLPCRAGNIIVRALMKQLTKFRNWTGRKSASIERLLHSVTTGTRSSTRARKYA